MCSKKFESWRKGDKSLSASGNRTEDPMSMNRREFLKLGLLAAAPQLTPLRSWNFSLQGLPHASPPKKVMVVGAGLAGLVAAYELTQAGHDLTILEAQMRPGGRVLTLREPFSDGLYAEAGAGRIPDTHDLTLHYVKHFGLPLVPFYPDKLDRISLLRGQRIRVQAGHEVDLAHVPMDPTPEERRGGMSGLVQKYIAGPLHAMGNPTAPDWPTAAARAYDSVTMAEFLTHQGASHDAIELLEYPFASAEADPISLLWTLREIWYQTQEKRRYKISGGNDLLPKAFPPGSKTRSTMGHQWCESNRIPTEFAQSQYNLVHIILSKPTA